MARPRLDGEQLEAILRAVARVVASRRADGTRLTDVAKEAGVSVGTLQHYFGNRDDLIAAAFRAVNDEQARRCRDVIAASEDPHARLQAVIDGIIGPDKSDWLLWSEFWSTGARSAAIREQTSDIYERWSELIEETVADGIESGHFVTGHSPHQICLMLVSYGDGLAVQLLLDRLQYDDARRMLGEMAELLLGVSFDAGKNDAAKKRKASAKKVRPHR